MNRVISNPGRNVLDEIDLQIISELQKDGRAAFSQIAETMGFSPGMIRLRYNRLVESGFLKVLAISNPVKMGYKFMAMIGIKLEGSKLNRVAEMIAELDEVIYLIATSGAYDLFAEVICTDQDNLLKFLGEKLTPIDGIQETEKLLFT